MILVCSVLSVDAQVNAYARVTNIDASGTQLTINNLTQTYHTFNPGEQVIVMQMQDDVIGTNTSNNTNFGRLANIQSAGLFDLATISSITSTTMTLAAPLHNDYHINSRSRVQVISFRKLSSSNYTTTSNITALAWNGNVGGVVAIQVPGTLTLAHSITADGKGFRGGAISANYENGCEPSVYTSSSTNYGAKGEGIYRASVTDYATGRARLLNGGGGGSDDNAGGGGGGNITTGGEGGHGWTCESTPSGGLGGAELKAHSNGLRVFMGGGGGGGQQNNGHGTAGGAGGGIIIIRAAVIRTICSGNVRISANGITPVDTQDDGNDGAGGGGAGGTVMIQANSFDVPSSCPLQVTASGGNGGSVKHTGAHGGGGGGAQGAVVYSLSLPTNNVTTNTRNGLGGFNRIGGARAASATGTDNEGIMTGINIILPIELISFTAKKYGQSAVLDWKSTDDTGIDYYVEHSIDGVNFNTLAVIKGAERKKYSYVHRTPATGRNYYRLKMKLNTTGLSSFSPIAYITNESTAGLLAVYPNPAKEKFVLRIPAKVQEVLVSINDLMGKPVYTNGYPVLNNAVEVYTGNALKPGVYIIEVSGKNYRQTGRLIIRQ
jgi:hypothetical protein